MKRMIRVCEHGPELQNGERLRILTDSDLTEEDGTRRCELDQRRDDQERRPHQKQQHQAADDVQAAFDPGAGRAIVTGLQRNE